MKTLTLFLGALMVAGLLLSVCSGENALVYEIWLASPTGQGGGNLQEPGSEVDEHESSD